MFEIFLLYLWTRLDVIGGMFVAIFVVSILVTVIWGFLALLNDDDRGTTENIEQWKPVFRKWLFPLAIIGFLGTMLTPSKDDAILIVGGYMGIEAVRHVAQDERLRQSHSKAMDALDRFLDSAYAEEASEEVVDE